MVRKFSKRTSLAAAILFTVCAVLGICFLITATQTVEAEEVYEAEEVNHNGHEGSWSQLTGGALTGGETEDGMLYYYLDENLNLSKDITITGYITICLNGCILTGTGNGSVITVKSRATLILCDCQDGEAKNVIEDVTYTSGVITGGTGTASNPYVVNGGGVYVNGTFTMYGGAIAANGTSDSMAYGGGVYVDSNSTFNMIGGEVSNNSLSTSDSTFGGGVYVDGAFNMYGGIINGNNSKYGGGVYVESNVAFAMYGGIISGNNSGHHGGGVYVSGSATFNLYGGNIVENSSGHGGGVYVYNNAKFFMSGGVISGNSATNGSGVYVNSGVFTMEGGYFDGIITNNSGTVSITGGFLSEDSYDSASGYVAGGNVAVDISSLGDEVDGNYTEGFPYAVYVEGDDVNFSVDDVQTTYGTYYEPTIDNNPGGATIAYSYTGDGSGEGLPTEAGEYSVTATLTYIATVDGNTTYYSGTATFKVVILQKSLSVADIDVGYSTDEDGTVIGAEVEDITIDGIEDGDEVTITATPVLEYDGGDVVGVNITFSLSGQDAGNYAAPVDMYIEINGDGDSDGDSDNDNDGDDLDGLLEKLEEIISELEEIIDDGSAENLQMQIDAINNLLKAAVVAFGDEDITDIADGIDCLVVRLVNLERAVEVIISEDYITNSALGDALGKLKTTIAEAYTKSIEQLESTLNAAIDAVFGEDATDSSTLADAMAEIIRSIDAANSAIEALQGKIGDDNSGLLAAVAALEEAINNAESGILARLNDLETSVSDLKGTLKELQELVNSFTDDDETSAAIEKLLGMVDEIATAKSDIENLQESVAILEGYFEDDTLNGLADRVTQLESDYNALNNTTITALEIRVSALGKDIQSAIAVFDDEDIDSLTEAMSKLLELIGTADEAIEALEKVVGSGDSGLIAAMEDLQDAFKTAQSVFGGKITALEEILANAVDTINSALNSGATDIAEALEALIGAYEAADLLMRSDFTVANEALSDKISALESMLETVVECLNKSIDEVQSNLESEVARLEELIAAGVSSEITSQIAAIEEAYEAADIIINSNITNLESELKSSISSLEEALTDINVSLQSSIEQVQDNLGSAVESLRTAIEAKVDSATLTQTIVELETAYEAADIIISSNMANLESELKSSISSLGEALSGINSSLQSSIKQVQANLDSAVEGLQTAIEAKADSTALTQAIAELAAAYEAADIIINSNITNLESEFKSGISSLKESLTDINSSLQSSIEQVQTKLDSAVESLRTAIEAKVDSTALTQAIAELEAAYEAANALLNSGLSTIENLYEELAASISSLDSSYKAADEAIWAAIKELQSGMDSFANELNDVSNELNTLSTVVWVFVSVVCAAIVCGAIYIIISRKKRG